MAFTRKYFRKAGYLWFLLAMPLTLTARTTRIYVMNSAGTTIDVIDPETNKVVQVIEGIMVPEAAHLSPDGRRLYIANGSENFLDVFDRKTGERIKRIPLSGYANDMAVTKDGKHVLVCIRDVPGALDIVDTVSLEKVKTIPVKISGLHDIGLTGDGKYAVAGSPQGKFATVFDLQTEQIAWEVPFDLGVLPLAVESGPDGSGRRIFLTLEDLNGFAVVDFSTHEETARIKLPDDPTGYPNGTTPSHGISIAPDGKTLWVNSKPGNSVFVYSLPDLKLLGHVPLPDLKLPGRAPIGAAPQWLTFTPDSKKVYVCNGALRSVSAIDVKTLKVVATIPVGEVPDRISTEVVP